MISKAQIMVEEFTSLMELLKEKHLSLNMKASGRWLNSLEVIQTGDSVKLIGEHYTYYLVNGRKAGKFPPIAEIKKWIINKGIVNKIKGDISISSLAFLIARKIAREGTEYFKRGGTELVSSVFTPERLQIIIDKIGAELTLTYVGQIRHEFQKMAA